MSLMLPKFHNHVFYIDIVLCKKFFCYIRGAAVFVIWEVIL